MRLTLRTLLGYRDRVLNESDLSDLHKRIQQSEMAGNLLRRMDALDKRPQLMAPRVDGRGLGGDANSVAEYLDDSLQREKVPELERICLESDAQLAELAQCHALLSSALNTSVDCPEALRDRVFALIDARRQAMEKSELKSRLGDSASQRYELVKAESIDDFSVDQGLKRVDAAHRRATTDADLRRQEQAKKGSAERAAEQELTASSAPAVQSPMVASGGQSIRPTGLDLEGSQLAHEVPEYLRGRTRDGWRGPLAFGALAATLALLIWQSLGPWESVKQMFVARAPQARVVVPPIANTPESDAQKTENDNRSQRPTEAAPANQKGLPAGAGLPEEPPKSGESKSGQAAGAPTPPEATPPAAGADVSKPPDPSLPNVPPANQATDPAANPLADSAPSAVSWLPTDAQEKRSVLLVAADGAAQARRIAAAETLPSGSRIVVPPATRATLDLARQLRWTVCGPTKMLVRLDEKDAARAPTVELTFGRALIASGPSAKELDIQTSVFKARITLENTSSLVAIELSHRPLGVGSIIDSRAFQPVLTIVAADREATVALPESAGKPGERISLKVAEGIGIVGDAPPVRFMLKEIPSWYRGIADRPIDVQAADDLHRTLANNPRVHEVLTGLLLNRRPETAAIAAQTLAMLGQWDGIAGPASLLNSINARSHWANSLDLVRQLIAAEPLRAQQLRAAFTASEPVRGNLLCDLLLGLPEDRLQTDGFETLVGLLESEFMNERVLAGYQLKLATGKDYGYQANDPERVRAAAQQLRRDLSNKRVRILPPAPPLWEAK